MSDGGNRLGWYGVPALDAQAPPVPREAGQPPAARGSGAPPEAPRGALARIQQLRPEMKVTLGLAIVSGLVIFAGASDLVGPTFDGGSDAATGALDAIRDVIGLGLIVLGIGLFSRRELARRTYFFLAAFGYFAILDGANSAGLAVTVVSLVLQTIPIVFLTRKRISATFR
jgi:hypothetical protein